MAEPLSSEAFFTRSPSEAERQHDHHSPAKSGAVFEKVGCELPPPPYGVRVTTQVDAATGESRVAKVEPIPPRVDRRSGLPTDLALHELRGELGRVLTAIRRHRDQRGDDRCWLDDRELYAVLPEGYTPPAEDSCVELERCQQYIRCRHDPATTYVSPQRRIEELEAALAVADRHCEERLAFQQSEHEALVRGLRERVAALEAELLQMRDKNRNLHRRVQQAESEENERTKPLREELWSMRYSREHARQWFAQHGMNWECCRSELERLSVALLLDEKRAAEAKATELAGRAAELEALLAAKDRFQRQILERLQACSEALGRVAEGEAVYEPWPLEELRQWEGELT